MGNKSNKPLSEKAFPRQALSSGEKGDFDVLDKLIMLRIPLVQIELSILEKVSIADSIAVEWKENAFYCLINKNVLGKIPANYNYQLDIEMFYKGTIVELDKLQPKVTVQITV